MNQALWEKAVAFHGHECPGLAIGFKACQAAMEKLGLRPSEDEEIVCVTENDACGVDAIQAVLSCTLGKGNLLYRGTGKRAYSFFDRKGNQKLRMHFKAENRQGLGRSEWQAYVLNAPVDELFDFSEPQFDLPEEAQIFATIICESCGEGAAEHKIHLQGGKKLCLDCYQPYERGW